MATILILDEGTLDRELTAALGHHGHRLLELVEGEDALGAVRAGHPDLILADILLPEPGGFHFVQRLLAEPVPGAPPRVVFVSPAYLDTEARTLARACGVSHLLTVPAEPTTLLAAIGDALSGPPPAWLPRAQREVIGRPSRQMAGKLYRRMRELERANRALSREAVERAQLLESARAALGQEVTKRLWAERELTHNNRRLMDRALRDALTGLYNRGYLEESLDREASRARRSNQLFGIMMIDIDHFKHFNDTHGHAAGDAVLRAVGRHLLSLARAEDIPCRYGGEEFALVMTHAAPATVRERAEKLRQGVQELHIESEGRGVGPITLSVGIAMFPEHGDNGQAVLQAADAALYRAKAAGRNCVVVAGMDGGS